ncbi:MAG: kynureninase, partial [Cyclobacteriaceae bacterium]|nr:kynureninase [Cyclobacteriaceae bacterium]
MTFENSIQFARSMDRADPLQSYRKKFLLPKGKRKQLIYFTGNSLGLQPVEAEKFIMQELHDWATLGVEGHFHAARPWMYYHKFFTKPLARLVGAKPQEVAVMNQLTVNLHLMMVSFYRPTPERFKIISEAGAFSSDMYAIESQVRYHGFNPDEAWVEIQPRPGEYTLRTEDILETIRKHGESVALVLFSGVQYYTGQFFNIRKITEAAHAVGAMAGFDLAHAVGNVPLSLHKDNVDFAVWCSYKYLNAGPGSVAGIFVHERHGNNFSLPRFAGWWGHDEKERFKMKKGFKPMPGAEGWQVSNFPVLAGAAQLASLQLFEEAGIKALRRKSQMLTGYLEFLLREADNEGKYFQIITPVQEAERGCQLSLLMKKNGKRIYDRLVRSGVVVDWRGAAGIPRAPRHPDNPDHHGFDVVCQCSRNEERNNDRL